MSKGKSNELNIGAGELPLPYGICKKVADFKKIKRIGEGAYGYVYLAKPIHSDRCESNNNRKVDVVALKRIIMHNESQDGFPITSLREIKTLRRCSRHVNIVKLLDVVIGSGRDAVFLVFEYCEHDLASLISNRSIKQGSDSGRSNGNIASVPLFKESEVKCLMCQLLSALEYIHENHVVHRDIKLSNLLYNSRGELKVADFGLARTLSSPCDHESNDLLTTKVVTLWYRAPELLLGCIQYSFSIDMWSTGCIFTELLTGQPLLPGETEMDQITLIFSLLGSPNERIWYGVTDLPAISTGIVNLAALQEKYKYNTLADRLQLYRSAPLNSEPCLAFANSLLSYDPDIRSSARDTIRHAYFRTSPMPTNAELMPTFPDNNDENLQNSDKIRRLM